MSTKATQPLEGMPRGLVGGLARAPSAGPGRSDSSGKGAQ